MKYVLEIIAISFSYITLRVYCFSSTSRLLFIRTTTMSNLFVIKLIYLNLYRTVRDTIYSK